MVEETLTEKLDKIIIKLEEKEDKKKFKLPFGIRMGQGSISKKNKVIVQFIRTNGSTTFKIVPIEDGTIKIGEYFYESTANYILKYNKLPLLIIKEWDMKPLYLPEEFKEALEEGRMTAGEKYILTRMKMEMIKPKMNFNIGTILIILGVIVGGLIALNYFGLLKF